MYDHTEGELQRTLGRLESAVEALTREVRESTAAHTATSAVLEARVSSLERWRVYVVAFISGVTAAGSILATALWRFMTVHFPAH